MQGSVRAGTAWTADDGIDADAGQQELHQERSRDRARTAAGRDRPEQALCLLVRKTSAMKLQNSETTNMLKAETQMKNAAAASALPASA
jgi:hypothetical protein